MDKIVNRYIPLIIGLITLGIAAWIFFNVQGLWKYPFGGLWLVFTWVSWKKARFATDTHRTKDVS